MSVSSRSGALLDVRQLSSPHTRHPADLTLGAGECIGLLGPSGSGKSVLLRLIADLDPGEGVVMLQGRSRASWAATQWRSQVVYQPAEPAWWAATPREHFAPQAWGDAERLVPALGLDADVMDREIPRLSTGERQRLALIRTLSVAPRAVLLDEPTASLDAASTLAVEALLRDRLARGLGIVMVTHSREQATRFTDRVLEFVDGHLQPGDRT